MFVNSYVLFFLLSTSKFSVFCRKPLLCQVAFGETAIRIMICFIILCSMSMGKTSSRLLKRLFKIFSSIEFGTNFGYLLQPKFL